VAYGCLDDCFWGRRGRSHRPPDRNPFLRGWWRWRSRRCVGKGRTYRLPFRSVVGSSLRFGSCRLGPDGSSAHETSPAWDFGCRCVCRGGGCSSRPFGIDTRGWILPGLPFHPHLFPAYRHPALHLRSVLRVCRGECGEGPLASSQGRARVDGGRLLIQGLLRPTCARPWLSLRRGSRRSRRVLPSEGAGPWRRSHRRPCRQRRRNPRREPRRGR
jgi:hypothetical protein